MTVAYAEMRVVQVLNWWERLSELESAGDYCSPAVQSVWLELILGFEGVITEAAGFNNAGGDANGALTKFKALRNTVSIARLPDSEYQELHRAAQMRNIQAHEGGYLATLSCARNWAVFFKKMLRWFYDISTDQRRRLDNTIRAEGKSTTSFYA